MTKTLNTPFKSCLELKRYPHSRKETLQAWDSADELILDYLSYDLTSLKNKKILILNDQFGALASALADYPITAYTDSYVSFRGTQFNTRNVVTPLNQLKDLAGIYDYVLIRIPKNMSFFEDLLCHLTPHLNPQSKIICGYMIKHQAASSFQLLDKYIGETNTSLARKKARLIFADFQRSPVQSPYPISLEVDSAVNLDIKFRPFQIPFVNHSNLFSREKLDIGTRFLLSSIPKGDYKVILDLGCANGIIGIAAKKVNPSAKIVFSDESYMAIQSAMTNYSNYFQDQAKFHWTHCYEGQESNQVDLVICNPPFHQGNTVGDFIAYQMFTDAHRALVSGGKIRVIGNSHLQYQVPLKKIFGNSQIVATNNKFVIVDASKIELNRA